MAIYEGSITDYGIYDSLYAIIASKYNREITDRLVQGALKCFEDNEVDSESVNIYYVPGAFEIPVMLDLIKDDYEGIITLGCIIKGDTAHFEYVSNLSDRNFFGKCLMIDLLSMQQS